MKKVLVLAVAVMLIFAGYLTFTTVNSKTPTVVAAKKTYSATVYVAGHGGHFAKADLTVDPNNENDPIKINSLNMVSIGSPANYKTHDARIDSANSNILFWSTYALDDKGKMHVGKLDLKTGNVIKDVALDPDPRAPGTTGPIYCASGQSKNYYMPVFMGAEGYVDVFDKKTMEHKQRVFISDLGYKPGSYQYVHGSNSHDMKKFLITVGLKGDDGNMNGKQDLILVDLPSLEKGKMTELKKATLSGVAGKTITFRQYFSKDDKLIFQSAGDRVWVIDAATLKLVDEKMTGANDQNHDVMPTPDGKYALLTLRTADTIAYDLQGKPVMDKEGKPLKITDGTLMAYDADAKKLIGKPVSLCFDCHKKIGKGDKNAILCGIDANYKK
ncbi:MAG: hypothetical protein A2Z09_05455 [Nitrospirae bacterium RBG_16_43_8]|nr:MAG: hypothetical protein A2Z09_05455 [Nitrospirae bacterium RBG_16_43_8]